MLLDDFFQIALPCLLILVDNEWRTLLSVEGELGEWFEVDVAEKRFVLGVVEYHIDLSTSDLPIQISCFLLQCHSL